MQDIAKKSSEMHCVYIESMYIWYYILSSSNLLFLFLFFLSWQRGLLDSIHDRC